MSPEEVAAFLDLHIPSLSDENENEINELVSVYSFDLHDEKTDVADFAIRTCRCGLRIDGFYEYVAHLKEVLST